MPARIEHHSDIGLYTVLTPDFVPGALTMIHSFLRHNRWFDGDITVLHRDLRSSDIKMLERLHPKLRCQKISDSLNAHVTAAVARQPKLNMRYASFFKGDLLSDIGPERILYVDADMVFQRSVRPLLDVEGALLAAGDKYFYSNQAMSKDHYAPATSGQKALTATFGAGLMLLSRQLRGPAIFHKYLDGISSFDTDLHTLGHTDQKILNQLFDGQVTRIGPEYNYHLPMRTLIQSMSDIDLVSAAVIHFGGFKKPWDPLARPLYATHGEEISKALALWQDAYQMYLRDPYSTTAQAELLSAR